MTRTNLFNRTLLYIIAILFLSSSSYQAFALTINHYAQQSVLSSGKWIKISTTEKGVHRIDAATLRGWGFEDASKVSLYGKDGYMLPETFSENDSDDLTPLPVYVENGDLYFYASGGTQWQKENENYTHTNNYYSNIFYYFLTEDKEQATMSTQNSVPNGGEAITTFDEYALHENDLICVGQTGRMYFGENLIENNQISIKIPDLADDKLSIYVALGANSKSTCTITTSCNGTTLTPNITLGASDSYTYLKEGSRYYDIEGNENITLTFKATTSSSLSNFFLDYVRLFYTRHLILDTTQLHFRRNDVEGGYFAIDIDGHKSNDIRVWDVTNVNAPVIQTTSVIEDKIAFTPNADNEYVAFDINNTIASPQYVYEVEKQDLHGTDYIPDMVIITTRAFIKEADRIAQLHREMDNMKVLVCEQLAVFNEFSGGTPDATAIRRMMKMFYDRANAGYGDAPRYLLLYGRSSYNNRLISPSLHNEDNLLLVSYQSESSTDHRYSYITDDYFGILGDNTGKDITSEEINLGIGRIPVKNMEESQKIYNKLYTYINQKPVKNMWKNKACFIGYNGDNNLHVHQMNTVSLESVEKEQQQVIVDKVYLSAYNSQSSSQYDISREQIFHDLEEGTMIFSYMGHAGPVSLGVDFINIAHAKGMNNSLWPVFITATCDVCPFDKDEDSVGEELFRNDKGGFIGLYTTTRTVYTNGNESINRELLREFYIPEGDGKIRLGDVMRRAKKTLLHNSKGNVVSDPNKLKYCLIGDPAMSIPLPTYTIVIDSINGAEVTTSSIVNAPANSQVTICGSIYTPQGKLATDYNGSLCYEVYDAEEKMQACETISTSTGNVTLKESFGIRQYKLATAADTIINGRFTTSFYIPAQTLQSNNTALVSFYAFNESMDKEAAGYSKNILINGIADAPEDVTPPSITNIWMGDEDFREGGLVESNTVFHCELYDGESGIANNELPIGKRMIMMLDGKNICNDLAGYYSPDNEYGKGYIDYLFRELQPGTHHATIKVFDNAGNAAEATIAFYVEEGIKSQYTLHIEEDPVITQATLSIDGVIEEDMNIRYVIAESSTGKEIWTTETTACEVVWNLATNNGDVTPGEYVGYALINTPNGKFITEKKKLIVLMQ